MRDKPGRRAHEIPGLDTEIKSQFQFGNAPTTLDGRARIALDRQTVSHVRHQLDIFNHQTSSARKESRKITIWRRTQNQRDNSGSPERSLEDQVHRQKSLTDKRRPD